MTHFVDDHHFSSGDSYLEFRECLKTKTISIARFLDSLPSPNRRSVPIRTVVITRNLLEDFGHGFQFWVAFTHQLMITDELVYD